jgi:two-component system, cell cycle response regulator DivK
VLRVPQSILLIEPDIDERDMYAWYLHTSGFTVQTADSADDGLMRASEADVIVTGMWVPGSFDGAELVWRLRNADATKRTPIIVLAADAFQADRQRAYAAGCDGFVPTPCLPDRLASEVRAVLSRRRIPIQPQPERAHVTRSPQHPSSSAVMKRDDGRSSPRWDEVYRRVMVDVTPTRTTPENVVLRGTSGRDADVCPTHRSRRGPIRVFHA